MKRIIQIEELGLFLFFTLSFFLSMEGSWEFFLLLFFVPDFSFLAYLINKKIGAIAYNILHHRAVMVLLVLSGILLKIDVLNSVGIIFLAHASFDRMLGYGLKHFDSFQHTHLGWIGKNSKV